MQVAKQTMVNWKEIFSKRAKGARPPVCEDLEFLYDYVTEKRPFTILEFGSGCSTVVMADAHKWIRSWTGLSVFSFDNERKWLWETQKMIPEDLKDIVSLHYAMVHRYLFYDDTPVFSYFYH